jgi:hypothetical protein
MTEKMTKMPKELAELLDGRKTYLTALVVLVVGILHACGVEVPSYVWASLAALGMGFLRAAVKKAEI